jgi:hypothetical protein
MGKAVLQHEPRIEKLLECLQLNLSVSELDRGTIDAFPVRWWLW